MSESPEDQSLESQLMLLMRDICPVYARHPILFNSLFKKMKEFSVGPSGEETPYIDVLTVKELTEIQRNHEQAELASIRAGKELG